MNAVETARPRTGICGAIENVCESAHNKVQQGINGVSAGFSSLRSRCWKVVSVGSEVVSRTMGTYDGIDYGAKFLSSVCLIIQLWHKGNAPVAKVMGDNVFAISQSTGAVSIVNRANVFISGKHKTQTFFKNMYCVCLVLKSTCDTLRWLGAHGVLALGKLASAIGGSVLVKIAAHVSLSVAANVFGIVGFVFDIVNSARNIASGKAKSVPRELLTIANDIGKMGCCSLGFMFFSWQFALIACFTGATSLIKTGFSVWDTKMEEEAKARAALQPA